MIGRRDGRVALQLAGALAAVVCLLFLAEGACRLLDLFPPPPGGSKLRYQRIALPLFTPARLADGREVLATSDPRLPFQWIANEKPAGERRVFFFGGSAMAGLGHSPNVSLPREVEDLLEGLPGTDGLRIYNLGIVAFSTRQIVALVEDVLARCEPDLLVVYEGNNEFLEIHSEAYARAIGKGPNLLSAALSRSALVRGLTGGHRLDRAALEASVSTRDLAQNDARVDHSAMIDRIELSPEEIEGVYAEYRANLAEIAIKARDARVPLLLCTPSSNWEWAGLADKDASVRLGYGPGPDPTERSEQEALLARIDAEIPLSRGKRRWELEFAAAGLLDRMGQPRTASVRLRRALELDPHGRRATPRHAELVRDVCAEFGTPLFDLAAWAEQRGDGRIGFDLFYDYVHFTPLGVAAAARPLAEALLRFPRFRTIARPEAWPETQNQRAGQGQLEVDGLAVGEFLGFGATPARIADRNLWKYDRTLDELDQAIAKDPADWRALCWRGNAAFFRPGGLEAARADYAAAAGAAEAAGAPAEDLERLADNRRRLEGDRRP